MKLFLRVFILSLLIPCSNLSAQLFNFTKIESPSGANLNQVVAEFQNELYISYFDNNYNQTLFSYSNGVLEPLGTPADLNYGQFLAIVNDQMYIGLNDFNFNGNLAIVENGIVTVYPATGNATDLGQFLFESQGNIYLTYFDATTFDQVVKIFDGANFSDLVFPAGLTFDNYLGFLDGNHYMFLEGPGYEPELYSFSNGVFNLVPIPNGLQFPFPQFEGNQSIIFSAFDYNFNQFFYELENDIVTQISLPAGYEFFTAGPEFWKDELYFAVADGNFDGESLAKRASDGSWTVYDNLPGLEVQNIFPNGLLENEINLSLVNPNTFENSLGIFDGNAISSVVPSPTNFDLSGFLSEYKGGKLLTYFDNYYFNNVLWYLKDNNLSEVPIPTEHPNYSFFAGRFGSNLYLAFQQDYYSRSLYQLSLNARPESADSSVTTFAESPYSFKINDFPFSDTDDDGAFGGIQISTLPTNGILHLNGAQVNIDDIITVAELPSLFYVPLDDGTGSPYDQFKFRVWDSFEVSDLDYTMLINVLSTSGTNDNFLPELNIYPNPSTDIVNIEFADAANSSDLRLSIIDASGSIVLSQRLDQKNLNISVDRLSAGNYFLVIFNKEKSALRKLSISK